MNTTSLLAVTAIAWAILSTPMIQAASPEITRVDMVVPRITIRGNQGATNVIEYAEVVSTNQWLALTNLVVSNTPYTMLDLEQKAQRFYRTALSAGQETNQEVHTLDISMVPRLTIQSDLGVTNLIEYAEDMPTNQWLTLTNLLVVQSPYAIVDITAPVAPRFYRVFVPGVKEVATETNAPDGMVLILSGSFKMGDTFGDLGFRPIHRVQVSAFYMDKYLITKLLWDEVSTWAMIRGYTFDNVGRGKAHNHPIQSINWWDVVKWCNARSEKEGRVPAYYTSAAQTTVYRTGQVDFHNDWVKWNAGYRLPTEAEWEKAARGGLSGQRFPWGNTITHSQANYYSYWRGGKPYYTYDINPKEGCHPSYNDGVYPFTSPVGSFAPNGYGLYDMAGNVWEWCWDWFREYSSGSQTDPRGSTLGAGRVVRGGCYGSFAGDCWVAARYYYGPNFPDSSVGFRSVLPSGQ